MVRKSSRDLYTGISMPKELMDLVDKFLKEHPHYGIKSRAEYVKRAIRRALEEDQYILDTAKRNYKKSLELIGKDGLIFKKIQKLSEKHAREQYEILMNLEKELKEK